MPDVVTMREKKHHFVHTSKAQEVVTKRARSGVLVEGMGCPAHLLVDSVNSVHATTLMTICQVKMTMVTVITII